MSTVTEYLADHEVEFTAYDHPRADTAVLESLVLGISPDRVAKTLLLDTTKGHVLAVVPASRRLDMRRAGSAVGDPHVKLASESEIAKDVPGFELGATPPIPGLVEIPVVIDETLARQDQIFFASGRQTESVRLHTRELLADPFVTVAPLCDQATYDRDSFE